MEKEVRFTEKKVDQSWKEEISRGKSDSSSETPPKPGLTFSRFLTSLGYQTLMHLGELPYPESQERHVDLEAAKETIDLLILLESKSRGNRTAEEDQLLKGLLAELQMKYVEKVPA